FVAGLRQADGTFEARSIDLATGEIRVLIPRADVGMHIDDHDDGIAVLEEDDARGGGSAHARLIRVPSRDPSGAAVLDDIDLVGLQGGDRWNPWPMAKTNGRETVWLHAGGLFLPHDVILQTADGQKRSVYQTDQAVWFDIDDNGRVAIATLAAPLAGATTPTTEELFIYEGGPPPTLPRIRRSTGSHPNEEAHVGSLDERSRLRPHARRPLGEPHRARHRPQHPLLPRRARIAVALFGSGFRRIRE